MKQNKIPIAKPWITEREIEYSTKAVESTWISSKGEYIEKFEDAFAKYLGVKYALSTCNGSAACQLCFDALDIGQSEVLCPNLTYVATANAISLTNNKPVFMDVNPLTWNCDYFGNYSILENVKAVFLVHLLGNPVSYQYVDDLRKRGIIIIEDACEALGGSYKDKKCGTWGECAAFSYFSNKSLAIGEGGMLVTNDENIYKRAKLYRGQGQESPDKPYYHSVIGYNFKMTNLHAAIGLAQIERVKEILQEKKRVYSRYYKGLGFGAQFTPKDHVHSNWMFGVYVSDYKKCKRALDKANIESRPMFNRMSSLPPYKHCRKAKDTNSKLIEKHVIILPSYPQLEDHNIDRIIDIVRPFTNNDSYFFSA